MSGWKTIKLGMLADVKGGKRLPKGEMLTTIPNTHPYIRIRDLGKSKTLELTTEYEYVDDQTQKSIARYIVSEGDILLSIVGTIGLVGIVGSSLEQANQTENCVKITKLKGVDRDFLYYHLTSKQGQYEIRQVTVGAVQPKLPLKNIQDLNIPVPPLPTQKKIAAVLGALDDKIENNRKICKTLEEQAQAIFKSWFVDFDPFGGKRPDGWRAAVLGDIAEYDNRRIPVGELTADSFFSTENMLSERGGVVSASSLPESGEVPRCDEGSVLVSNIRPYFKKIHRARETGGHSADVLCFVAKDNLMRWYLYRLLWDDAFFAYVMSGVKGCKMPRGDKEQIMEYGCVIPDKKVLEDFNAAIEPMCQKIALCEQESRALAELRDALLPKLMSGEIDVEKVVV